MILNEASGVYSTLTDKSGYTDESGLKTIMAFFPIFSSRGPDNVIKLFGSINTQENIESVYGKPVFTKYGQAYHNAIQWAKKNYDTGICRLMPSDAQYANLGYFYSKTKTELTTVKTQYTQSGNTKKVEMNSCDKIKEGMILHIGDEVLTVEKVEFTSGTSGEGSVTFTENSKADIAANAQVFFKEKKVITKPIQNAINDSTLERDMKTVKDLTPDTVEQLFMVVRAIGRGVDYNKLSISISTIDPEDSPSSDYIYYNFRIYDKKSDNGLDFLVSDSEFDFSFDPDAVDLNNMSTYILDTSSLYNDITKIFISNIAVKKIICDMYNLDFANAIESEIYSKDIFQGNIDFIDNNKNRLGEGSDGSLWNADKTLNWGSEDQWEGADLTNCVNLIKALYSGQFDDKIMNDYWYPIKYIFDANFPLPAKLALAKFADSSLYTMAIIDTGFISDSAAEVVWRKNQFKIDSQRVAIYPNHGIAIDEYTGKKIKVTSTYNVISKFALVKNKYGFHYAVGGYNEKGRLDELVDIAYSPVLEQKNQLVKNQFNTIEKVPDGIYIVENTTAKKDNSALQQLHIADAYQDIEFKLRNYCKKYILNFRITDSSLKEMEGEISGFLSQYISNGCCEFINTKVSASAQQRNKQQVAVNVGLKFTGIARQVFLNFEVLGEGSR